MRTTPRTTISSGAAGRFWTSINVMPDFPSVAQAILNSYEAATGERLDGVILADPFAEAALLEATGPVQLPGYDVEIDADNVVAFTTNEAYSLLTNPVQVRRCSATSPGRRSSGS
jgi:Protein of unknown function (DUF4012)